jgi:hypothetical protein
MNTAIYPLKETMQSALQIVTKVLPDNRIEVQIPSGSEGQNVTMFIVLPTEISPVTSNHHNLLLQIPQDPEIQTELAAIDDINDLPMVVIALALQSPWRVTAIPGHCVLNGFFQRSKGCAEFLLSLGRTELRFFH